MKFNLLRGILVTFYSLTLTTLFVNPVLGENKESVSNSKQSKINFSLPIPPSRGIPLGRHTGGGSRGFCQNQQNLMALVPLNNQPVWGKTISTHPEFLFYLPQGSVIEFVLQDEQDNYIHYTNLQVSSDSEGIVSIPIPKTAKPLEPNKNYQWTLSVSCKNNNSDAFLYVKGSIEKADLQAGIKPQLEQADELEKAVIYAREGIWYDLIATLAQLRRDNPNDKQINIMWTELLEQVNLTEISSQPILN